MREIYDNAGNVKFGKPIITTNETVPRSSGRRWRGVILCVGLLIVFLLAALIGFMFYYYNTVHRAVCPTGWTEFNKSCYFLSTQSKSWTKGREDCKHKGADLVIINSANEQDFLSEFTKDSAWIGLSDRDNERTWKWVDGTPLTVTYWARYQPDNYGGNAWSGKEDCVEIRGHSAEWNDLPCDNSLRWICERKP